MARLTHPLAKAVATAMKSPGDFHRKVRMVASHLVREFDDDEAITECLHEATQRVKRRRMSRAEVANVVQWVRRGPGHGVKVDKAPREQPVNPARQRQVDAIGWSLDAMREKSDPIPDNPSQALAVMYPGDPFICIGYAVHDFAVRRRSEWQQLDLSRHERLCPNPFNAPFLTRPDGSTSFKCNELIHHRRFLVIEFDDAGLDQQATRLGWLGKRMPLALVLFSGSKSLHGYYRCDTFSKPSQRLFFELALSIGADRAMWCASQFSRLPGGLNHKTGIRQTIHFIHAGNATARRYQ